MHADIGHKLAVDTQIYPLLSDVNFHEILLMCAHRPEFLQDTTEYVNRTPPKHQAEELTP